MVEPTVDIPLPKPIPEMQTTVDPDLTLTDPVSNKWRTTGWIGIGAGAATAVAGIVTGMMALNKSSALESSCPDKVNCSASDRDLQKKADGLAVATDILLPTGAAVAAAGVVLLLLTRNQKTTNNERGMNSTTVVGVTQIGLGIRGRF